MKLNLGCNHTNFGKDWIHIDESNYSHIHSNNIIDLPFDDNSIDIIYASHVICYFDRNEIIDVLHKWKSKLKKNGILRLALPDYEMYNKLYYEKKINLDQCIGPLYGKWTTDKRIIYHKTTYDYESLSNILKNIGFTNIHKWNWENVEHSNIDDYSQAYIPHMDKQNGTLMSLNIECNN